MKTTPQNRKIAGSLLALHGFNLAGMLVWPEQWYFTNGQSFTSAAFLQLLYYAIFLTALPMAAGAKLALQSPRMVVAGFLVAIAGLAIFPALLMAVFSLPTFALISLISGLNFSALCLIAAIYLAKRKKRNPLKLRFHISIAILLPAWSVLSVPALYGQAALKADGIPYCVAFPSDADTRLYTPEFDYWALRGISLAAKETQGGSESFQSSFHALLYVKGAAQYWNWSKTRMRFEPLKYPDLWSDIRVDCATP